MHLNPYFLLIKFQKFLSVIKYPILKIEHFLQIYEGAARGLTVFSIFKCDVWISSAYLGSDYMFYR